VLVVVLRFATSLRMKVGYEKAPFEEWVGSKRQSSQGGHRYWAKPYHAIGYGSDHQTGGGGFVQLQNVGRGL